MGATWDDYFTAFPTLTHYLSHFGKKNMAAGCGFQPLELTELQIYILQKVKLKRLLVLL